MKGLGFVGLRCRDKREEIIDNDRRYFHIGIKPGIFKVLPVDDQFRDFGVTAQPDIICKVSQDLLIAVEGAGGVVAHPEVIAVALEPLRKIPAFHALFYFISNK